MKAIRFDGSLKVISDASLPCREGEALVQMICAGICATDLEIVKGYAGFRGTLGHEFVGRVAESPDPVLLGRRVVGEINAGCGRCSLCLRGDSRHCPARTVLGIKGRDGAMAEFLSLPVMNLIEVPESITDEAAVFVEPLAAACRILEQVEISPSTFVGLLGDGKLAQLIARAVARTGCNLTVFGKHEEKLELASLTGARCILVEPTDDGASLLGRASGERFDVVIEATGTASGLSLALALVRPLGTVVLKTTHHGETSFLASPAVVNEITIIGSRCGRFQKAVELLAAGQIDVAPLISDRFSISEGLLAFARAARSGKVLVKA
jgi:threonine dehydrogenase-like Zn-dependent dehydrogenase